MANFSRNCWNAFTIRVHAIFKCSNASHFSLVVHWTLTNKTSSMSGPNKPTIKRLMFIACFCTSLVHPLYIKEKGLIVVLPPFTNTSPFTKTSKSLLLQTSHEWQRPEQLCTSWADKTQKCNFTNPSWELFPLTWISKDNKMEFQT